MTSLRFIEHMRDLVADVDVVLSDIWGVVHNGLVAFPEACEALHTFRQRGGTVVLITNAPRPADSVQRQLRKLGVADATYDAIVSSGDLTRHFVADHPGKTMFWLGPERDNPILEGLDIERAPAGEATSVVCTGFFDDETQTPEDYTDMLVELKSRNVPMICANPDLVVERGHRIIPCAGAMAAYYEQLGGSTRIAGKPHRPIYEATLAAAREVRGDFPIDRVLAIGDGMPTDVRGALDYGLDLLYISGGIHAKEYTLNGETDEAILHAYLEREKAAPKWWMPRLA